MAREGGYRSERMLACDWLCSSPCIEERLLSSRVQHVLQRVLPWRAQHVLYAVAAGVMGGKKPETCMHVSEDYYVPGTVS